MMGEAASTTIYSGSTIIVAFAASPSRVKAATARPMSLADATPGKSSCASSPGAVSGGTVIDADGSDAVSSTV